MAEPAAKRARLADEDKDAAPPETLLTLLELRAAFEVNFQRAGLAQVIVLKHQLHIAVVGWGESFIDFFPPFPPS
jgi:hypothetical protein